LSDTTTDQPAGAPSAIDAVSAAMSDMTLGELEDLEVAVGIPADRFQAAGSKGKLMAGVVWIVGRRRHPEWTLDDARALTMTAALELLGVGGDAADPPRGGSDSA
jgi:hypothetical protein